MLKLAQCSPNRVAAPGSSGIAAPRPLLRIVSVRFLVPIVLGLLAALASNARAEQPPALESGTQAAQAGGITEAELKQMLAGKFLYLRGGYLDNSLSFTDHGALISHSPQGSFTLNVIQIDKVSLTKHKLELQGVRYGLHFLGAQSSEDPAGAQNRVRITPRKKHLRITIARMQVVKPRRKKEKGKAPAGEPPPQPVNAATTTTSPAYAAKVLRQALDNVFASSLDVRMMAAMPAFWKPYYQAADSKTGLQPTPPGVLRADQVDRKPRLLAGIDAPSNEYAQAGGIAGLALYHAIIGADGRPEQIAVGRPIGFGLDENAVAAIRKARFEPAMKDGKPVPVALDMVVEFRIYSKLTSTGAKPGPDESGSLQLPGPYSELGR